MNNEEENYEIPLAERKIVTQPSDPPIKSLVDKINRGRLIVNPEFQRKYVWENKPIIKSRLIESVILRVPIPTIYIADENGREIVIDGQQRLQTFHGFLNNKFKLKGLTVLKELNGVKYNQLNDSEDEDISKLINIYGNIQDRICDTPIRVVKILQESHPDIKFEVFERLNRGSVKLSDQELRNCLYRGTFNELLKELIKNQDYLRLQGLKSPHKRMADAERILRFFVFCDKSERNYKAPMKKFLNEHMKEKQNISEREIEEKRKLFKKCVELCQIVFGDTAFRRFYPGTNDDPNGRLQKSINQGIFDIQMYCFKEYDKRDIVPKSQVIRDAFLDLLTNDKDFIDTIEISTYSTNQVKKRTEKWFNALREIAGWPSDDRRMYTYEEKKILFDNSNICSICNNRIAYIEDAHVDHIERFSEGGRTTTINGRLTHRFCNLSRR